MSVELRPCEASGHGWYFKGFFHRWIDVEELVPEDGYVAQVGVPIPYRRRIVIKALCETKDGRICEIDRLNFRFLDREKKGG